MKKIIQFVFVFASFGLMSMLMSLSSCKGDTGAVGASGQVGPTGPGAKSKPGIATSLDWTAYASTAFGNYYAFNLTVPDLTQAIHDKGTALVYMSDEANNTTWHDLPFVEVRKLSTGATYTSNFRANLKVGSITIIKQDSDGTTPINPGLRYFKIILIEGALPPHVDPNSYEAVSKYLSLAQ